MEKLDKSPLIIQGRNGLVRQVFSRANGEFFLRPDGTSVGLPIILIGDCGVFPVVDVVDRIGPFNLKQYHDIENPVSLQEVFTKDFDMRAKETPEVYDMNGIYILKSDNFKISMPFEAGTTSRKRETADYLLLKYNLTDKFAFMRIIGGDMYSPRWV
jgi:hypothetical protein